MTYWNSLLYNVVGGVAWIEYSFTGYFFGTPGQTSRPFVVT
jgi:hypothetical protein